MRENILYQCSPDHKMLPDVFEFVLSLYDRFQGNNYGRDPTLLTEGSDSRANP